MERVFRRVGRGLVFVGPLFLAVALAHVRVVFFGDTFTLRDSYIYTLPSRDHLAAAIAAGQLPEWWDAIGLGIPFAASPSQSVTYPPAWLVVFAPRLFGADLLLVAHLVWLAIGQSLLARRLGAGTVGALFAGAALATCGYATSMMVNHLPVMTLAWTPWVVWATDRLAAAEDRNSRIERALHVAALVAAQVLSGDPAGMVTSAVLASLVGLIRARRRWQTLGALMIALAAAVVLAAVAVVPGIFLLAASSRSQGISFDVATQWSMHPLRMLEWVWPRVLGEAANERMNLARLVADTSGGAGLEPSWAFSEYLGAPVLLLAAVGAGAHRDARRLLALSLLPVLLALGRYTPIYGIYRALVLPEHLIRYPEKHIAAAFILWTALAGVGLTRAFAEPRPRRAWAAAALVGLLSALVAVAHFSHDALALALAPLAGARYPRVAVGAALRVAESAGTTAAVAMALVALALALASHRRLARLAAPLIAVVAVGNLIGEGWALHPLAPRSLFLQPPELLARIPAPRRTGSGIRPRLYRPFELRVLVHPERDEDAATASVRALHDTAVDDTAASDGFAHFPGYDPAFSARLHEAWERGAQTAPLPDLLSWFAVDFALVPAASVDGVRLIKESSTEAGDVALVRVLPARPRAFVASRWHWGSADDGAATWPPAPRTPGIVQIEGVGPAPPALQPALESACTLASPRPEEVDLGCKSLTGGYAVLLDADAPGWSATVDGRPVAMVRADGLFRAVAVDAGEHAIRFRYRTPGLRVGALVSAIAWLSLLVLSAFLAALRRRSRR